VTRWRIERVDGARAAGSSISWLQPATYCRFQSTSADSLSVVQRCTKASNRIQTFVRNESEISGKSEFPGLSVDTDVPLASLPFNPARNHKSRIICLQPRPYGVAYLAWLCTAAARWLGEVLLEPTARTDMATMHTLSQLQQLGRRQDQRVTANGGQPQVRGRVH